ncbi:YciI family protein [Dactylosporangium sp. NPDC049525]|uniref:YciI family protein n=1 Tax=Dactylosporangium sp. NPDC049525 TaxID=3154730 RepID=UPI00343214D2
MKQYMLAVHHDYDVPMPSGDAMQAAFDQVDRVNTELRSAGAWVFGGGLLSPDTATVVHAGTGNTTMTDGPYTETKEQLGGFWVIRCADLDEALVWAEKCSEACMGPVEVRPFEDEPA